MPGQRPRDTSIATMTTAATTSYTSPIQSSFTANPLTTTFTPPATCTGAYTSGGVYVVGEDDDCKPSGFADASTDYFSPGLACPSGYYTACHDNEGVASITTVTCCPALDGGVTLGCVTPSTLSDVWATLFCTWIAPADEATTVSVTLSSGGTTSTVAKTMSSPGGLNAQGIRMVYEASDMSTSSTGSTGTTSASATATATGTGTGTGTSSSLAATATSTSSGSSDNSSGLSTGATAAIAVVIAVVGIGGIIGVFFWLRKRKQRREHQQQQQYGAVATGGGGTMDYKYTGRYDPANTQELSGVGAQGVRNQQQELVELGSESPVELPANDNGR